MKNTLIVLSGVADVLIGLTMTLFNVAMGIVLVVLAVLFRERR